MSLTGGPFSYNRFDEYEKSLSEGKGASTPEEMKKKVDKAGKKAKGRGVALEKEDEKEEEKEEVGTAEGGMSEEVEVVDEATYGGSKPEPKKDKKMLVTNVDKRGGTPAYKNMKAGDSRYKAADHMGESFFIEDEEGNIYEGKKDACYHKVKSRYDVWPSAYASGALVKCRKKGAANWGNSDKKEMFDEFGHEYVLQEGGADLAQRKLNKDANNSKLKVTKAVMESEQRMAMYSRALGVMGAHYSGPSVHEASKPDYLDFDKDGDKEEDMKKALKEKGKKSDEKEEKKESVELTKEMVVEYLVAEGYASNEVSAEILHTHVSDEFLEEIEEKMIEEYLEEGNADQGVSGDEAMKRHGIKAHEGPMKVKKLKPRNKRKGEGFEGHRKMANPMPQKPGATGAQNPGGGRPNQG